ncbi:MAG: folylpolyglutamate synthase/dihydrofolate synthase family protein [Anaerolineales bacterium]|jgi:dihydrofolate synthase/folylpolyglutamate synthase|nr:folylpolyglutamate synthase/dihydrofolate synthase family protein [Anaerolineales bacterium]
MDTETRYNLTLDYLYSFVDYSLKKASELARAEFNLARMEALLEKLGNPQRAYPVIHVAGTKGKGSVCALCASALQAGGYKTGLYTSPHLLDYAERIQVNGQPIPHEALIDLVEEIKPAVASVPKLTTFEITTALGFLYFARQGCTAAVIEVGLGGRLDATNVIRPNVAVITSISYDHTAILGDTLTLIAREKGGIIKEGCPLVSAPQTPEALAVLKEIAAARSAPLTLVGQDITVSPLMRSLSVQTFQVQSQNISSLTLSMPLLGSHQIDNAATAFAALEVSGLELSYSAIQKGFYRVKWPVRFEIVQQEPAVIFDSAHNRDSFFRLRQTLNEYFPNKPVILIFGVSEDKMLADMLEEIRPRVTKLIATRADHPRALEPEKIVEAAGKAGLEAETATPVEAALARALELAGNTGIVLSAGSLFVTAEVKRAWEKYKQA